MTVLRHFGAFIGASIIGALTFLYVLVVTVLIFLLGINLNFWESTALYVVNVMVLGGAVLLGYCYLNLKIAGHLKVDRKSLCRILRNDHPHLAAFWMSMIGGTIAYLGIRALPQILAYAGIRGLPHDDIPVAIPFALLGMLFMGTAAYGNGFLRTERSSS